MNKLKSVGFAKARALPSGKAAKVRELDVTVIAISNSQSNVELKAPSESHHSRHYLDPLMLPFVSGSDNVMHCDCGTNNDA